MLAIFQNIILGILAIGVLFFLAGSLLITISRRSQRAHASANQADLRGMHLTMACPAADNAGQGPLSGEPLVFGRGTSPSFGLCGVSETNYTPPTGTPTGNCSVNFEGVFNLTVVGKSSIGGGGLALAIGDQVYADDGTYDPVTGCLYGFTLNGNASAGCKFGVVLDAVASGVTQVTRVRLKQGA